MTEEINFDFSNNSKPKMGSVLISEPFLSDDYFTRSVIILCEHNKKGAFGFVLNNYIESSAEEIFPEFEGIDVRISIGGPVDHKSLFYIHSLKEKLANSFKIRDDLYLGGDFEQLKEIINKDPSQINNIRFFIGYSGWGQDQLKDELDEKSWLVLNDIATPTLFDTSKNDIWKDILDNLGGRFKVMTQFPINPSDN